MSTESSEEHQAGPPLGLGCNEGLGAVRVPTSMWCRACRSSLTLDEMHYFEDIDGSATCSRCEAHWSLEVSAYMRGERDTLPHQP